jgi:hypothetical protein
VNERPAAGGKDRVFRSAVDWWLAVLVFGAVISSPLVVVVATIINWPGWVEAIGNMAIGLIAPAIVFTVAWPIDYTFTGDDLVVRAGLFLRWRVPISGIERIEQTRNPLSSPAMSLNRLRITYRADRGGPGEMMISPVRRDEFLTELERRGGAAAMIRVE